MTSRIVCFGEILVRLSAPGRELLLQSPTLDVCIGGAEANVAVALAKLGRHAAMASALPDNALGDAALSEVRRHGVDVSGVQRAPGRMGLYFLTPGAGQRPQEVLYDRAGSALALAPPDLFDWPLLLEGAAWLHVSGITAAISASAAESALRAVKAARAAGVQVSFDSNFRGKLWAARVEEAPRVLAALAGEADLLFGDHRDIARMTGVPTPDSDDLDTRRHGAAQAFAAFPKLARVAMTARKTQSVDHHELSAAMFTRDGVWTTPPQTLTPIVERIGGGDAFAAGLLFGLDTGLADQEVLDFALAAACLKHTLPGDFNLLGEREIRAYMSESRFDVRR